MTVPSALYPVSTVSTFQQLSTDTKYVFELLQALVTGDPSGNTPSVDVFVTTSTPEAFGDGQSAGTSIEGGG